MEAGADSERSILSQEEDIFELPQLEAGGVSSPREGPEPWFDAKAWRPATVAARRAWFAGVLGVASLVCLSGAAVTHWARANAPQQRAASTGSDELVTLAAYGTTAIRWALHPSKCLDVGGDDAGAPLQIWDCDPNDQKHQRFIVPPDGETGRIVWAADTNLCLDAPSNNELMFWMCDEAPDSNTQWMISPEGRGRIKWALHPTKCINVPDELTTNGHKLQLWDCDLYGREKDYAFITHSDDGGGAGAGLSAGFGLDAAPAPAPAPQPEPCKWGEWSRWSECSKTCGRGIRARSRDMVKRASNGGACDQSSARSTQSCWAGECATTTSTTTTTWVPTWDEWRQHSWHRWRSSAVGSQQKAMRVLLMLCSLLAWLETAL